MPIIQLTEEERLKNIEWAINEQEKFFKQMDEEALKNKPADMPIEIFYLLQLKKSIAEEKAFR